jgi:IS5 family transposase
MILQRLEGLSDREAVDRFAFDLRWKYASGSLDYDYPGFVHTVLVDMRARLRRSERPDRIFETVVELLKGAGLVGHRRVLDSTPLYDAVATQDTVTLIRSSIRGLLRVSGERESALRSTLGRDDDYKTPGKPACDWDDEEAREALVDALARDGFGLLAGLENEQLSDEEKQACSLLATVLGQDLEENDGNYRIARRVAEDRVISTVDPETRHGHKTAARSFDGYKGHVAIDPDSELITACEVTAGNVGDAAPAKKLLSDVLDSNGAAGSQAPDEAYEVYGDASYGTAELVEHLQEHGIEPNTKVQAPAARKGMLSQDAFEIDTDAQTARCPNGHTVRLRMYENGNGLARFGKLCEECPMKARCTSSQAGRVLTIHPKHDVLRRERERQRDPEWKAKYQATRPKVERKLAHMMRRRHGGRRARVRGMLRVAADFSLLAAATNLSRAVMLGLNWTSSGWSNSLTSV